MLHTYFLARPGSVVVTYRVSWIRKDENMTTAETEWVKDSIQNYIMETNGRVMNEVVGVESISSLPLKDKCIDGDMR